MDCFKLIGMAVPWDIASSDRRKPKEPAACGLEYHRLYRPDAFTGTLQRIELGAATVPLVWGHDGHEMASTADGTLRLWNGDLGLMFSARVRATDPAISVLTSRRFGCSVESGCRLKRYEFRAGKWTKIIFGADLVHLAIEREPAFGSTWIRLQQPAAVLPFRRNPGPPRAAGGLRIYA
jgi:hypothetical protein